MFLDITQKKDVVCCMCKIFSSKSLCILYVIVFSNLRFWRHLQKFKSNKLDLYIGKLHAPTHRVHWYSHFQKIQYFDWFWRAKAHKTHELAAVLTMLQVIILTGWSIHREESLRDGVSPAGQEAAQHWQGRVRDHHGLRRIREYDKEWATWMETSRMLFRPM